MKFPLGHDSPFLFSHFHKYHFSLMNHHILIAGKMIQNPQCRQVLFLVPYNQEVVGLSSTYYFPQIQVTGFLIYFLSST